VIIFCQEGNQGILGSDHNNLVLLRIHRDTGKDKRNHMEWALDSDGILVDLVDALRNNHLYLVFVFLLGYIVLADMADMVLVSTSRVAVVESSADYKAVMALVRGLFVNNVFLNLIRMTVFQWNKVYNGMMFEDVGRWVHVDLLGEGEVVGIVALGVLLWARWLDLLLWVADGFGFLVVVEGDLRR
jgi:hypothetical protein